MNLALPNIEDGGQRGDVDGQLNVPPVLDVLCDEGEQDDSHGPEGFHHTPGHRPVLVREQLHHHRVGDALETLEVKMDLKLDNLGCQNIYSHFRHARYNGNRYTKAV